MLVGILMVSISFISGIDSACGSIDYDNEKEVSGDSIVVLS